MEVTDSHRVIRLLEDVADETPAASERLMQDAVLLHELVPPEAQEELADILKALFADALRH